MIFVSSLNFACAVWAYAVPPKRSLSSYVLYTQSKRSTLPDTMAQKEKMKKLGEMWNKEKQTGQQRKETHEGQTQEIGHMVKNVSFKKGTK